MDNDTIDTAMTVVDPHDAPPVDIKPPVALVPALPAEVTGYAGVSESRFDERATEILLAPINEDDVAIREDGIVYPPGWWFRRRLTAAVGPGAWAIVPRGDHKVENNGKAPLDENLRVIIIYHGALFCHGRFVSESHGTCTIYPNRAWSLSYHDALEGAKTDCLSRCCKDLGMATELWDRPWIARWKKKHAYQAAGGKKWFKRDAPASATAPAPRPATPVAPAAAPRAATIKLPNDWQASIDRLRHTCLEELGMKPIHASNWLNARFPGKKQPESLTPEELATAIVLLETRVRSTHEYEEMLKQFETDGRVSKPVTK